MIRRRFACLLGAVVLAAAYSVAPAPSRADAAAADVTKGNLFSAVSFADSAFGLEWSRLRAEARARFPDLGLTNREDLHVTVVYIGSDWTPESLDSIRAYALVAPAAPVRLTPEIVRLGRHNQVVALELHGSSSAWADSVVAAKAVLNRLGLKKPEGYDTNFRSHITLARAMHSPPSPADSTSLDAFQTWMSAKIAEAPRKFSVILGPGTRVQLLLAGATRPEGAPEYVTVEDFLRQQTQSPPPR